MKNLLILMLIFFLGVISPEAFVSKAEAQSTRREKTIKRKKKRKVRRTTRRRVRRRVSRRAHVRYKRLPKYRTVVSAAPKTAVVVTHGTNSYRYNSGVFYKKNSRGFVVVRPVRGVRVKVLPKGHRRVVVANRNYYYYYGTFYTSSDQEYKVVDAPEGAVVDALPDGYEVVTKNDQEYYLLDGVHYQEVDTDEYEDKLGYEVVVL